MTVLTASYERKLSPETMTVVVGAHVAGLLDAVQLTISRIDALTKTMSLATSSFSAMSVISSSTTVPGYRKSWPKTSSINLSKLQASADETY